MATNQRNIVTRCKFLVASLFNVNDAAHRTGRSIRFDCLKISRKKSQFKFGGELVLFMQFGTFFMTESKARYDEMFVLT